MHLVCKLLPDVIAQDCMCLAHILHGPKADGTHRLFAGTHALLGMSEVQPLLSIQDAEGVSILRYLFSTCLSLWNRQLVGRGHGVLGLGPFPGERCKPIRHWRGFLPSATTPGWQLRRAPCGNVIGAVCAPRSAPGLGLDAR